MAESKLIVGYKALVVYLGGRSRAQLWRDIRAGALPAPIRLGKNSVAWYPDEVDAALAERPRVSYPAPTAATAEPAPGKPGRAA